jgi:hypothetical protein
VSFPLSVQDPTSQDTTYTYSLSPVDLGGGGNRFNKNSRFNAAQLARIAQDEAFRRRQALDRAKVHFNTKDFNDFDFDNDVHLDQDNSAKAINLADNKDLDSARLRKSNEDGGELF